MSERRKTMQQQSNNNQEQGGMELSVPPAQRGAQGSKARPGVRTLS
jgi:hypothetical protein